MSDCLAYSKGPRFSEGIIDRTGAQTMIYLTCTTITGVDFAHYGVSHANGLVSVDCGTSKYGNISKLLMV